MKRRHLFVVGLATLFCSGVAIAADQSDPTGTWTWTYKDEANKKVDVTLKLKYADGKLTGTVKVLDKKEIEIRNATFKDGKMRFETREEATKERKKTTTKFLGKVDGDKITGSFETSEYLFDWEAEREKSTTQKPLP